MAEKRSTPGVGGRRTNHITEQLQQKEELLRRGKSGRMGPQGVDSGGNRAASGPFVIQACWSFAQDNYSKKAFCKN